MSIRSTLKVSILSDVVRGERDAARQRSRPRRCASPQGLTQQV